MRMEIPEPLNGEMPSGYADRLGTWYSSTVSTEQKKKLGQYFTPQTVAAYMASLCESGGDVVRILDPGAGAGILACAVCEHFAHRDKVPVRLELEVYEDDRLLGVALEKVLSFLKNYLLSHGVSFEVDFRMDDFVLKYSDALSDGLTDSPTLFTQGSDDASFDVVISNPPYFKIPKSDARAKAAHAVIHGQPNIYALFMAVSASVLKPRGELVFITPRSFASGPYFRLFRERFFNKMRPLSIHVFRSRREAFKHDEVLQENVILRARRDPGWSDEGKTAIVSITSSNGCNDFDRIQVRDLLLDSVLDMDSFDKVLHIPVSQAEDGLIRTVKSWSGTLKKYGLQISTGPVVPFRATSLLGDQCAVRSTHAPLLWMQHVKPMSVEWPLPSLNKPQYLKIEEESLKLLVPDKTYVLIRRFSAKEDRRRLVAAPLFAGELRSPLIGLENHVNYVHRPGGTLSEDEAIGLAALFNTSILDTYFRTLNGNTQVSATEIRSMPLPDWDIITKIGQIIKRSGRENDVDSIVDIVLYGEPCTFSKQANIGSDQHSAEHTQKEAASG